MEVRCGFTADCLAADGDALVCIGGDGDASTVSVYSASRGEAVRHLRGHTDKVTCVACEGDVIASSGRDKTIRLWSRESGACTAAFGSGDEVAYGLALRGGLLLCGEGLSAPASGLRAMARLWQLNERCTVAQARAMLEEHLEPIRSVALTESLAITASQDGVVCVWELPGRAGESSRDEGADEREPSQSREAVTTYSSVARFEHPAGFFLGCVDAAGDLMATGCGDGRVRLWSLSTRQ